MTLWGEYTCTQKAYNTCTGTGWRDGEVREEEGGEERDGKGMRDGSGKGKGGEEREWDGRGMREGET